MDAKQQRFLAYLCILIASTFTYIRPAVGGLTLWDVTPQWTYRAPTNTGAITFNTQVTMNTWTIAGDYITFTTLGTWSSLGLSCSSNAAINILEFNDNQITYRVTAAVGATSTTRFNFPTGTKIYQVDNASTWSQTGTVLTVTVLHLDNPQITIYVNPISESVRDYETMWGWTFFIACILFAFAELNRVAYGESGEQWRMIIYLALGGTLVLLILQTIEALW